jgi:hypothetical protein
MKEEKIEIAELREKKEIELQEKEYNDHWQSCCMTIDRRATRYFTQLGIAIMIITFCIVQLIRNETCESQSLYSGILMTVIGVMLPSPSLH